MKMTSSFETSGAAYLTIQRNIPEGRNPQLYGCENFITRTLFFHLSGETKENHVECFQDVNYKSFRIINIVQDEAEVLAYSENL
jgi:hypothetical protein